MTTLLTISFILLIQPGMPFVPLCHAAEPEGNTLAQRLIARYEALDSVSCTVRKITTSGGAVVRMLSRVTYRKPDRVHIEIASPSERRIVADGRMLFYYEKGAQRGFSRPIADLNETWTEALRNIPATPMEHLLRLRDAPETALPGTEEHPVRRGYRAGKLYVVLSCDREERPVRLDFLKSEDMRETIGRYDYEDFLRAGGCWMPRLHKAVVNLPDGGELRETRRVDNLRVNEPVDEKLFVAAPYFPGVAFTNDFAMTYGEAP